MATRPLVSVIIPMYNAEKFIEKCIEHLVHQTYKNIEIIIVDDGSTDKSVAICNNYQHNDARIHLISQKNGGPSVAMNTGLDVARGDYIHFHDHDDFVNLDFFEKMIDAALLTDADVLCGEVNQPEYNFPRFTHIEICTTLADKILTTCANKFNPAWRYVYKKEFLDKTGLRYEPAIFGAQDVYFTKPAIILAKTVATVPGAVYNVVNTPTALGKAHKTLHDKNDTDDARAVREKYNRFLIEHGANELMNTPDLPIKTEEFKIFNIPITKRAIFYNKVRYYLFGINIGTRRIVW